MIVAADKHELNLILYDDLFEDRFSKLKSFTLSNINATTIYFIIFDESIKLYQRLERLALLERISDESYWEIERLCNNLISPKMKSLKYLHLNFKWQLCTCGHCSYEHDTYVYLYFYELKERKISSHLETLIIGNISNEYYTTTTTTICFHALIEDLLPWLPELKTLIVNSINFEEYDYRQKSKEPSTTTTNSILPLNLKIYLNVMSFDKCAHLVYLIIHPNSPLPLKSLILNNQYGFYLCEHYLFFMFTNDRRSILSNLTLINCSSPEIFTIRDDFAKSMKLEYKDNKAKTRDPIEYCDMVLSYILFIHPMSSLHTVIVEPF
ncbi:unnamed protein product [Rotaria socialis]|uniref:Uncharacterized protein n=2 Tax=Rotaria socialis TaxID=392032 RepID=A0A817THL2_9BILA|nr:unnamed protein product [Rotaria socialis]CAF3381147.1 unnamed protein product [Rotaria socialis]